MARHSRLLTLTLGVATFPLLLACSEDATGPGAPRTELIRPPQPQPIMVVVPATVDVEVGATVQLTATYGGEPLDNGQVRWSSSHTERARVVRGMVTGLSRGEVVITADYYGRVGNARLMVRDAHVPDEDGGSTDER